MNLTEKLGVPWSREKLKRFATTQKYIGFLWDLNDKTVSMPQDKLDNVFKLLDRWLDPVNCFSASDAARLHGKLVHIASIFPLIRPFLRSAAAFAQHFRSHRAKLFPRPALMADLRWVQQILRDSPNCCPLASPDPVDLEWWGDASTSFGIGVVIGGRWAIWRWSHNTRVGPGQKFDIGWAEAVAVELGLHLAFALGLLEPRKDRRNCFLVRSDNSGIVSVITKGRSRSQRTNEVLKEIYHLLACWNVRITTEHVTSAQNISDSLSRGDIEPFWAAFPLACPAPALPLPTHLKPHLTPCW